MLKYLVKSPFTTNTPAGKKTWNRGEATCLSHVNAKSLLAKGVLVESNVGLDLLYRYEKRVYELMTLLDYSLQEAHVEAGKLISSLLKRHDALKKSNAPSQEFLEEVDEFNRNSTGSNPITKIPSDEGAGEWAGYRCNIGEGCSHGCLYCYAENMAVVRFGRVESAEAWRNEVIRNMTSKKCKRYDEPIMFPTSHDVSPTYLPAYRCHLYNILSAGNKVVLVSKPHRECIEAICSEFSSFRDTIIFRFTIGGLNEEVMRHWEPGAPALAERLECLKYAFEQGYKTSVSAEPMLCGRTEAEKLYYTVEPYVTEDIWFGKMKYIGGMKNNPDPEIADQAVSVQENQTNDEILELVYKLKGLPKVAWKDSIKNIIGITETNNQAPATTQDEGD